MNYTRLILSVLALTFGCAVLGLSLTTATAAQSSTGVFEASNRQFYWDKEMLPDHVAYPILMAMDRAKLEAATPTERIYLQLEFGYRRLEFAQDLLTKGNDKLALTTATKGYKYLIRAGQEALDQKMPSTITLHVAKALEYQSKELNTLKHQFTDADRSVLDQLQQESESLQKRLSEST